MVLFQKKRNADGTKTIYICGFKLFSYRSKATQNISCHGENNHVNSANPQQNLLEVSIYGNNNTINIHTNSFCNIDIRLGVPGCPVNNCTVEIGENTTIGEMLVIILENNTSVIIGKDCLFSTNIQLWASDTHSILDSNGHLLNIGRSIRIGNHCWLGHACKIMKNTSIADHCVVGIGSIVTSCFEEEHCILAGVPARIVKRNIIWDRQNPQNLLNARELQQKM